MARLFSYRRLFVAVPLCLVALPLAFAQQEGSGKAERGSRSAERPQPDEAPAAERPPIERMDNRRLGELLAKHFKAYQLQGGNGVWRVDVSIPAENDPLAPITPPADEGPGGDDPFADALGQEPAGEEEPADDADADAEAKEEEEQAEGPGAGDRLPATLMVVTDERANRMRIMIPIRRFDSDNLEDLQLAMIAMHANFDRALDARYAVNGGVLWSTFIHPLSSLTEQDLISAIRQVRTLRETTGTSYSSGGLLFGGGRGPRQPPPVDPGDVI